MAIDCAHRTAAAVLAAWMLAAGVGCPASVPVPAEISYACQLSDECPPKQRCLRGQCVPAGTVSDVDAAVADRHADASIDTATDGASDAHGGDLPLGDDRFPADATGRDLLAPRDAIARERGGDVVVAPDQTPGPDLPALDRSSQDTVSLDIASLDIASPDIASPDTAAPDRWSRDGNLPDTSVADSGPAWWNGNWSRRHKIVFDNRAQAEALDHFPVLIALDQSTIAYSATQNQGQDPRFVDDDGVTVLPYEIERWNESGTSYVWVAVGRIDASSNTDFIWMYHGNPAAPAGQDRAAVWSNGFRGVWHLQQSPAGGASAMADSTSSDKHGTALNMLAGNSVGGQIDRGLDFDGSAAVRIDNSAGIGDPLDIVGEPLTLEGWVYFHGSDGTIVAKRDGASSQWQLQTEDFGQGGSSPSLVWSDSDDQQHIWYSPQTVSTDRWSHVAVTVGSNGVPVSFYLDGQPGTPIHQAGDADPPAHWSFDVAIGTRWEGPPNLGYALDAVIDEVRVSAATRSDAWMAAAYASMTGNLETVGPEEQR